MQTKLRNRIMANILIERRPDHLLLPRRRAPSAGSLISWIVIGLLALGVLGFLLVQMQILSF